MVTPNNTSSLLQEEVFHIFYVVLLWILLGFSVVVMLFFGNNILEFSHTWLGFLLDWYDNYFEEQFTHRSPWFDGYVSSLGQIASFFSSIQQTIIQFMYKACVMGYWISSYRVDLSDCTVSQVALPAKRRHLAQSSAGSGKHMAAPSHESRRLLADDEDNDNSNRSAIRMSNPQKLQMDVYENYSPYNASPLTRVQSYLAGGAPNQDQQQVPILDQHSAHSIIRLPGSMSPLDQAFSHPSGTQHFLSTQSSPPAAWVPPRMVLPTAPLQTHHYAGQTPQTTEAMVEIDPFNPGQHQLILSIHQLYQIQASLAPLYRRQSYRWMLIHSISHHGADCASIHTKLRPFINHPCIIVVKDTNQCVFGAFFFYQPPSLPSIQRPLSSSSPSPLLTTRHQPILSQKTTSTPVTRHPPARNSLQIKSFVFTFPMITEPEPLPVNVDPSSQSIDHAQSSQPQSVPHVDSIPATYSSSFQPPSSVGVPIQVFHPQNVQDLQCHTPETFTFGPYNTPAIHLDQYFTFGESVPCPLFLSPGLTKTSRFTIHQCEVWTLTMD